ncbi:MAG: hypothetical protein KDA99_26135, partial [Planctomycetales bacterium]|nr:hypothetical protein [Planctomycetales bacterium]
ASQARRADTTTAWRVGNSREFVHLDASGKTRLTVCWRVALLPGKPARGPRVTQKRDRRTEGELGACRASLGAEVVTPYMRAKSESSITRCPQIKWMACSISATLTDLDVLLFAMGVFDHACVNETGAFPKSSLTGNESLPLTFRDATARLRNSIRRGVFFTSQLS